MKILTIEDDVNLRQSIVSFLVTMGNIIESADSFVSAEDKIYNYAYDVIILDIGLPDGNGIDLIKKIRSAQQNIGLLILSARDSLDDKLAGLELGADDYLTKPFHLSELNARVNALHRRKYNNGDNIINAGSLSLNLMTKMVEVEDVHIELSRKEYDLLLFFMTNENRVLTKSAIAEHLWGDYMDIADQLDIVYSHIKNLRKKLSAQEFSYEIKTIYGMGYRWQPQQ